MTAYYVEPDPLAAGGEAYWLEGYAVGDAKLAGLASSGASAVDTGAIRVRESGHLTQASSTSITASTRVKFTGLASGANVTTFFGGNRVAARAIVQEGGSANLAGVTRIRIVAVAHEGTITTVISGRKKWEPEAAPVDQFVDVAASPTTPDLWIDVADAAPDGFVSVPAANDGVSGFEDVAPSGDGEPNPWTDA